MPDGTTTRRCPRAGFESVSHYLRAHSAFEKGQLQCFYDLNEVPADVMDAIDVITSAKAKVEAKAWEDSRDGS